VQHAAAAEVKRLEGLAAHPQSQRSDVLKLDTSLCQQVIHNTFVSVVLKKFIEQCGIHSYDSLLSSCTEGSC
jgi:hypothetical protein